MYYTAEKQDNVPQEWFLWLTGSIAMLCPMFVLAKPFWDDCFDRSNIYPWNSFFKSMHSCQFSFIVNQMDRSRVSHYTHPLKKKKKSLFHIKAWLLTFHKMNTNVNPKLQNEWIHQSCFYPLFQKHAWAHIHHKHTHIHTQSKICMNDSFKSDSTIK